MGKRPSSNNRGVSPPPSKRKQASTTTSKAVANFFTPLSKKEPDKMSWRVVKDSLLIGRYAASTTRTTGSRTKIAAFDFDSTLITSASGKVFSRDATDWKWWHISVPGTLRRLHEEGYLVAIISNQGGISLKPDPKTIKSDKKRLAEFKGKVSAVVNQLDMPVSVYAATARDQYRKPRTGIWEEMLDDYDLDGESAVDLENSFFVGDAGGREALKGGVKDHSCVDRDFAANVGISFHTPEEYFLHEQPRPFTRNFDPAVYLSERELVEKATAALPTITQPATVDIVLFCGSPGAGKSSYYWKHLQPLGYGRVNQDILKTVSVSASAETCIKAHFVLLLRSLSNTVKQREKCVKAATALLAEGTSVVIDNTNADAETRAVWIKLAQKVNVPIRCVLFTAPAKLCEHNDTVRALNVGPETNPESRTILPKLAFTGFASRYREPMPEEGFTQILRTDFKFEGSEEQKKLWSRYWV